MGRLVEGTWRIDDVAPKDADGNFIRADTTFRKWLDPRGLFQPESGRYHLYVSYACPWAHRTLVVRALHGLEAAVPVSIVEWFMGDEGWTFSDALPDHVGGRAALRDVYLAADPAFSGRVTVPVLWDTATDTIVNNESSEIIRMLPMLGGKPDLDLYPRALRPEIDEVNAFVYPNVNNGVYRCGFASTQRAYDRAARGLFDALDTLERRLDGQRWLVGDRLTEADVRLFTTLARFDAVYHTHFKCNLRRLTDYPNLWALTRRVYQLPGVADTVNLHHIRHHYFESHRSINPYGIVPIGPEVDFTAPAD